MLSLQLIFIGLFMFGAQAQRFNTFQRKFTPDTTFQSNDEQSFVPNCEKIRSNVRQAHPSDETKYYVCRNQWVYEMTTCPNGGIFDDRIKGCIDLCEQKKPCLNQGQCIILANLTLECVCRRDWTGSRCEIPLSSCANNPCGPNSECRMLKATDYAQDYVCLCNKQTSYGRNCQQTVPNPCLAKQAQFHPFAFSRRAYINCDGETIFFQPCYGFLYWNQEAKRCDRELPNLLMDSSLKTFTQIHRTSINNGMNPINVQQVLRPTGSQRSTQTLIFQSWKNSQQENMSPQQSRPETNRISSIDLENDREIRARFFNA